MPLITFEELKLKYQTKPLLNEEVNCKILVKIKDGYIANVNNEWEGFIPSSHLTEEDLCLADTEVIKALVISGADKSDRYTVSPKALREKITYEKLSSFKEGNISIKVKISKPIKGGAEVYIDGARAFLPGRYIKLPGLSPESWINQEISVLIEELDYKEKKIILNHRKAAEHERQKKAEFVLQKLKEGDIVEAPVLRIADFGVFVDLGGLDGLIPASELSWGGFNHPRDIVKIGEVVKARIFRLEKEEQRVALSVKQLLGDPWEQINSLWEINSLIEGKIVNEAPFGLFVELKPGVEALLHNSEIPEGAEKPKVNSIVTAKVIKIDMEGRKIGLSIKDIEKSEDLKKTDIHEIKHVESELKSNHEMPGNNIDQEENFNSEGFVQKVINLEVVN